MTAEHFISEAGYPQELHTVTTDDGYILHLHRVPRRCAKKTVFFQHGVLDTSLGWVCSNATDSLAFAAWDEGCDVWLGNSRSNPPRRHTDPKIPNDQYWSYTLNELGMKDVGAQLQHIHTIKCQELQNQVTSTEPIHISRSEGHLSDKGDDSSPYSLTLVGHSLGAAALLIYLVTSLHFGGECHRVQRLILMSPAGFHPVFPPVVLPLLWLLPPLTWSMERLMGRRGAALMIPGSFGRLFFFKIFQDAVQYPAIREFVKRSIRLLMNGDVSPWEFAMQLPHYDVNSMPGISVHSGIHLIQIVRSGRFQLFDYGSAEKNRLHYGQSTPIDIAGEYGKIDVPVDIVAGRNDGVIPPECVQRHVRHMEEQGVDVSYREFDYGHLEFSATVGHDLQSYILERIA